ncbi:MAG: hypothetical protein ACYCSX_16035 [Acidimicrobiales bacterium]
MWPRPPAGIKATLWDATTVGLRFSDPSAAAATFVWCSTDATLPSTSRTTVPHVLATSGSWVARIIVASVTCCTSSKRL